MSSLAHVATDPFTLTERLLWFILESSPGFLNRCLIGNRVKSFTEPRAGQQVKDVLAPADLPEVVLYPAGGQGESLRTSSGEGFEQTYTLRITTGNIRSDGDGSSELQRGLSAMKWEAVRAFGKWQDVFAEYPSVRSITVEPYADQGDDDQDRARGWVGLASIKVLMYWPNMEIARWT